MTSQQERIDYKGAGVNYEAMDPLKRLAQMRARETAFNLNRFGMKEIEASRGESAYVWEEADSYRAFVIEGLGTKNLVADAIRKITGKTFYDQIAQDTVAMIVNDLIVVGAEPQVVNAYFAVGSSEWFSDKQRTEDLVEGWARAVNLSGAVWGGGETPTLKSIIEPDTIDLSGAAIGIIKPKERLTLGDKLKPEDAIILIESSGIHANGLTLARKIAESLPQGFSTLLPSGKTFGEALLAPTPIYVGLQRAMFENEVDIHYMANITGHGWRKLMRAREEFTYRMRAMPFPQEEFLLMQEVGRISPEEMYATFNMGAGFAFFIPEKEAGRTQEIALKEGFKSWNAGIVEDGPKRVIIEPLEIVFTGETLQIR